MCSAACGPKWRSKTSARPTDGIEFRVFVCRHDFNRNYVQWEQRWNKRTGHHCDARDEWVLVIIISISTESNTSFSVETTWLTSVYCAIGNVHVFIKYLNNKSFENNHLLIELFSVALFWISRLFNLTSVFRNTCCLFNVFTIRYALRPFL